MWLLLDWRTHCHGDGSKRCEGFSKQATVDDQPLTGH
jgi:hypothetical protein